MTKQEKDNLKTEVKELIIQRLNISDISVEEIPDDTPLFASDNPLGLDSVDAIEIIMGLQEKYGVRIGDQNLARVILNSINSIVDFLEKEKDQQSQ